MRNSCRVQFSFGKKNNKHLVFSLPQTNHYQEISNLSLEPKTPNLGFDEWGNTVVIFTNTAAIEFLYSSKNVEKSLEEKWKIDDYKSNKEIDFFLKPNRFINGKDEKILKLAHSLIKNEQNVLNIAKTLYDFVLNDLSYGKPTEGLYPYSQAVEEKVTDCGGFSTLLLSLFQSVGIPGRLVVGFLLKKNLQKKVLSMLHVTSYMFHDLVMHAWIEILLPDHSWFPMDASVEWKRNHNLSKRDGGFGKIPDDRLVTSFGQDFKITVDGKKHTIDLLQLPIYL